MRICAVLLGCSSARSLSYFGQRKSSGVLSVSYVTMTCFFSCACLMIGLLPSFKHFVTEYGMIPVVKNKTFPLSFSLNEYARRAHGVNQHAHFCGQCHLQSSAA